MWTIELSSQDTSGYVRIERDDARHGMRGRTHWFRYAPTHRWISQDSVARLIRVAQQYATRLRLREDGWAAEGEEA